jgi:hypothetical protein
VSSSSSDRAVADKQGNGEWDSKVLQTLAGWVDLHSIHLYTTLGQETVPGVKGLEYENNVFGPAVSCFVVLSMSNC